MLSISTMIDLLEHLDVDRPRATSTLRRLARKNTPAPEQHWFHLSVGRPFAHAASSS